MAFSSAFGRGRLIVYLGGLWKLDQHTHKHDNIPHDHTERIGIMKTLLMIFSFLLICSSSWAQVGASNATIKLYQAYLSTSGDCSSPVLFLDPETDTTNFPNGYAEVDMASGPTIGSGSIAEGTYICAIFKMSDQISFVPDANNGACVSGTTYNIDVCMDNGGGAPTVTDKDGTTSTCNTANLTEDTIWVYISTFATTTTGAQNHNAFAPPTQNGDGDNAFKLNNDITISGDVTGTFTFGVAGKVGPDGGGDCGFEPPDFGFATSS
jgi:hypothetical protein